jgi:hypothetical protein
MRTEWDSTAGTEFDRGAALAAADSSGVELGNSSVFRSCSSQAINLRH